MVHHQSLIFVELKGEGVQAPESSTPVDSGTQVTLTHTQHFFTATFLSESSHVIVVCMMIARHVTVHTSSQCHIFATSS